MPDTKPRASGIFFGLVNSVDNLPDGQVKFLGKFKLQNCNQSYWSVIWGELVEMTFGLAGASYNLPEWQAVKLTFFAHCRAQIQKKPSCVSL